jgi:antitoxin PrlF
MPTATLTSKGQITLPLSVRNALGLHAGTKVDFIPVEGGFKVVSLQTPATALKGRFAGRVKKAVRIEAMDDAIAENAAHRNTLAKR